MTLDLIANDQLLLVFNTAMQHIPICAGCCAVDIVRLRRLPSLPRCILSLQEERQFAVPIAQIIHVLGNVGFHHKLLFPVPVQIIRAKKAIPPAWRERTSVLYATASCVEDQQFLPRKNGNFWISVSVE